MHIAHLLFEQGNVMHCVANLTKEKSLLNLYELIAGL
jgi:hypothetical protein